MGYKKVGNVLEQRRDSIRSTGMGHKREWSMQVQGRERSTGMGYEREWSVLGQGRRGENTGMEYEREWSVQDQGRGRNE